MSDNSIKNLIPFSQMPEDKQKEISKQGGIAKAEKIRKRKLMQEIIDEVFVKSIEEVIHSDKNKEYIAEYGEDVAIQTAIVLGQVIKALDKDTRAVEFLRDTDGQKMAEKIKINTVDEDVRKRVDALIEKELCRDSAVINEPGTSNISDI